MASIVLVPTVAVCTGAVAVLVVPFIALQEILEKRSRKNFRKHLKRRSHCKVNFGDFSQEFNFSDKKMEGCAASITSRQSKPPAYEDLFHPPPPYKNPRN